MPVSCKDNPFIPFQLFFGSGEMMSKELTETPKWYRAEQAKRGT